MDILLSTSSKVERKFEFSRLFVSKGMLLKKNQANFQEFFRQTILPSQF